MGNNNLSKLKIACMQLQVLKNKERIYKCSLVKSACSYLLIKKAADDDKDHSKSTTASSAEPSKPDTGTGTSGTGADTTSADTAPAVSKFGLGRLDGVKPWEALEPEDQAYVERKQDWTGYDSLFGRVLRPWMETDEHRKNAILYMTQEKYMNNPTKMREYLQKYGITDPDMQKDMIAEAQSIRNNWTKQLLDQVKAGKNFTLASFNERLSELDAQRNALYDEATAAGLKVRPDRDKRRRRPYDYSQYDIMADAFGYAGFPYHSRNWMTDQLLQYDDALASRVYKYMGKNYRHPAFRGSAFDGPFTPVEYGGPAGDIIDVTATDPNDNTSLSDMMDPNHYRKNFPELFGGSPGTADSPSVANEDPALRNYAIDEAAYNKSLDDLAEYKSKRKFYEDAIAYGAYPPDTTPEEAAALDGVTLEKPKKLTKPNKADYMTAYDTASAEYDDYIRTLAQFDTPAMQASYPDLTPAQRYEMVYGTALPEVPVPTAIAGPARSSEYDYGPLSYIPGRMTTGPRSEEINDFMDEDGNLPSYINPDQFLSPDEEEALAKAAREAAAHKNKESVELVIKEFKRMYPWLADTYLAQKLMDYGLNAADVADAFEQSYNDNTGAYEDAKNVVVSKWTGLTKSPTRGINFDSSKYKK